MILLFKRFNFLQIALAVPDLKAAVPDGLAILALIGAVAALQFQTQDA
jgi:hypothetical protein